jgi:ribosomal protein L31E
MIRKIRLVMSHRRAQRVVYAIRSEVHKRGLDKLRLKDINALIQKVRESK